jgi:hypothetical protein
VLPLRGEARIANSPAPPYHREMIDVRDDHKLDVQAFARRRERCAFSVKPPEFLAALIAGSRWIAHAYDPAAT